MMPRAVGVGWLVFVLAGCAAPTAIAPGAAREDVQARRGQAQARYASPAGEHWFYVAQPGERQRFDFDAHGRLVAMQQVFTRAQFLQLAQEHLPAAQVLQRVGPPARAKSSRGQTDAETDAERSNLWTYSWQEYGVWRLAQVRIDAAGLVQAVDIVDDPLAGGLYR